MQEYRRIYDLNTLVKEEEEDSEILATARATVKKIHLLSLEKHCLPFCTPHTCHGKIGLSRAFTGGREVPQMWS